MEAEPEEHIVGCSDAVRVIRGRAVPVTKSSAAVFDLCRTGHRVTFDLGEDGSGQSSLAHKKTGEKTPMKLENKVWHFDVDVIPKADTDAVLAEIEKPGDLCPFGEQVLRP